MKHFLLFLFTFLMLVFRSQDTVLLNNNDKIAVILTEINPDNVKFKRFDNQSGPVYTVLKTEIQSLTFSNGKKEVFQNQAGKVKPLGDSTKVSPALPAPTDTIVFHTGKVMSVKIDEITPTHVKYHNLANPDGPAYSSPKSEIKHVVFSSGLKQSFGSSLVLNESPQKDGVSGLSMARRGEIDAKKYYKHNGGSIGVGIVTGIVPFFGLIPAVACSIVPPAQKNMGYPDDRLWRNSAYKSAYTRQAHRIKAKRIWITFGVITTAWIVIAAVSQ